MVEVSSRAYRVLFAAILVYFVFFGAGTVTETPLLIVAAELLFGCIAVGIGWLLFSQVEPAVSAGFGAAAALVAGGVVQFAFLVTGSIALANASSLLVFAGIGLYIYAVYAET